MTSSKYLDSAGLTYLWEKILGKLDTKVSKVTSTDNAIARFDGTSGQILNSGVTISDSNFLTARTARFANTIYGISYGMTTGTPVETILKTGIRWINGAHMPVLHITGYAYGLQSPVEFKIGFYIYGGKVGWGGVTNMGSWKPDVYLFKYTNTAINADCVAVGLSGSCYFLQLQCDLQDERGKFNNVYVGENIWSWEFLTTTGNIPEADGGTTCSLVPYKADILDSKTKAEDDEVVHLAGAETISGLKTFTAGLKLNAGSSWTDSYRTIPFSANGAPTTILYVNDNNNTGLQYNPYTGALKAGSFVKRGGTAAQFLKADGSVDSSTYQKLLLYYTEGEDEHSVIYSSTNVESTGDTSININAESSGSGMISTVNINSTSDYPMIAIYAQNINNQNQYSEIDLSNSGVNILVNEGTAKYNGNEIATVDDIPTHYAGSSATGGTANKTASIPYAQVDSTSTSTAFTATVDGITELRDGVCCLLKNGRVTSASGFTLNVNGLGAKPCYTNLAAATRDTTIFNINYTMLFVYDSTRVDGGGWICYRGYDSTSSVGVSIRTNNSTLVMSDRMYRYRLYFTSADGQLWVPSTTSTATNATSKRDVNQRPIDPFGPIGCYGSTSNFAAGATGPQTTGFQQYIFNLGYAFNTTGAALTLSLNKPVYVKCTPQTDGSAIIDADEPYTQSLPTSEDGFIYIFLGIAYSATNVELRLEHPIYYYKDGAIRLWTNQHEVNLILNVTYSQLVTLRNNSQLVPGQQYRITDYVTTTVQENTQSAGHLFDVIVTADSTNTLNENARAAIHDGDTYFANSNLAAWLIKYTLDNDDGKYLWIDTTNGKGVIYWMNDEWENECPYDFKNILFKRYQCTDDSVPFYDEYVVAVDSDGFSYPGYAYSDSSYKFYYTFSKESDSIIDFSLDSEGTCVENKISRAGEYTALQDNVIIVRDSIYNNTFSSADMNTFICRNVYENVFGNYLYGNLIRTADRANTGVMTNTVGACFQANVVYTTATSVNAGSMMYNSIGNNFSNNYMTAGFVQNTIGNKFDGNATSGLLGNNSIGNLVTDNIFDSVINGNKIGDFCTDSEFNGVYFSEIGNHCLHIKFLKPYVYYTIIEPGNQYINITSDLSTSSSNKIQNIKICQGYNNSGIVRTITVPVVNNAYLIEYKSANSVVYN